MQAPVTEVPFFLDGKRRSSRTWRESDARAVPILAGTDLGEQTDSVFGFSSEAAFEKWVAKSGLVREFGAGGALLQRSPKELPRDKQREVAKLQESTLGKELEALRARLARLQLTLDRPDQIVDALSKYNPLTGPIIGSALLFEHVNGAGQARYVPSGWAVPDLAWLQFDDTCSSFIVWGGVHLWEQSWYRGRRLSFYSYFGRRFNLFGHPYYFNDAASSVISWK